MRLYDKYHSRGVVFIGLTSDDDGKLSAVKQFVRDAGYKWPNGYGANEAFQGFRVQYLPSLWVIGRDGRVVWNRDSKGKIETAIDGALAMKPVSTKSSAASNSQP